jgi:hypothetical protein
MEDREPVGLIWNYRFPFTIEWSSKRRYKDQIICFRWSSAEDSPNPPPLFKPSLLEQKIGSLHNSAATGFCDATAIATFMGISLYSNYL